MGSMQPPIRCPTEGCLVTSSMMSYRHLSKNLPQKALSRGLGHTVTVTDPHDPTRYWSLRHLYGHSSALASREAARRQSDMQAIEAELQRLQGLVNKYDYKTP